MFVSVLAAAAMASLPLAAKADWFADATPPANAKPLSDVIKSLANAIGQITKME